MLWYFIKNLSKMVSRAALDGSRDPLNWSFYDVNLPICKKSYVFVREWRTSMSPRSNEKHTFFENWRMYRTVCRVLCCGAAVSFCVRKRIHQKYSFDFSSLLEPILPPKRFQSRLKSDTKKHTNFNVPWNRLFDGFWSQNGTQSGLITTTFFGKAVLPIFEGRP